MIVGKEDGEAEEMGTRKQKKGQKMKKETEEARWIWDWPENKGSIKS